MSETTKPSRKGLVWSDIFPNVDSVGQSEFRALSELCADTAGIANVAGAVDGDTRLSPEQVRTIDSVLEETIDWATELRKRIASLEA